jgi:hypothetical protein
MKKLIAVITAGLVLSLPLSAYAGITNNHDKAAHVGASAAVGVFMAKNKPFNKWKPWQRVLFNVVVVGGAKELYDHKHPSNHSAEWGDIAADAVGAVSAEGVVWLVHKTW